MFRDFIEVACVTCNTVEEMVKGALGHDVPALHNGKTRMVATTEECWKAYWDGKLPNGDYCWRDGEEELIPYWMDLTDFKGFADAWDILHEECVEDYIPLDDCNGNFEYYSN